MGIIFFKKSWNPSHCTLSIIHFNRFKFKYLKLKPSLKQKASRGATHQILIPQSQAMINELFIFIHARKMSIEIDKRMYFLSVHEKKKK